MILDVESVLQDREAIPPKIKKTSTTDKVSGEFPEIQKPGVMRARVCAIPKIIA